MPSQRPTTRNVNVGASAPRSAQKVNPNAARDLADIEAINNMASATPDANATALGDLDLSLEYVKPAILATYGKFLILNASQRFSRRFNQDECVFTVKLLEGEYAGAEVILTLGSTPIRDRLVEQCNKTRGPVGPCVLFMVRSEGGSEAWAFVSPERAAVLNGQEEIPF